jgi:hypothetical protein
MQLRAGIKTVQQEDLRHSMKLLKHFERVKENKLSKENFFEVPAPTDLIFKTYKHI